MKTVMTKDNWLQALSMVFITMIIVSPILSTKVVGIGPLKFTAGMLTVFFGYQMIDMINEIWGKRKAQRTVLTGAAIKLTLFLVIIPLILLLPAYRQPEGYDLVLKGTLAVFLAAEVMNLVQNLVLDIPIFDRFKQFNLGFFGRSFFSDLISYTIGTVLFILLAFRFFPLLLGTDPLPWEVVWPLMIGQVLIKYPISFVYTAITTPVVKVIKRS